MEYFSDERDKLCQRFRESLSKPISERFYDEDELVDLFDYAGDLGDDYLRMEVLLSGARLYPDSEALRARRAIFYSIFEAECQEKFFQDNSGEGPMWDILHLPYHDRTTDLGAELSCIIEKYDRFDDEEIIQLVNVADSVNQFDWLINNLAALEAHTDFPQTLYYEVGIIAEQHQRYDKAIEMFERLTDDDPSNSEHWFLLAQNYMRTERYDDALNAIEFALALQPKSMQMRALRASIFYKLNRSMPLALKEIEELRKDFPDDPELLEMFAGVNDSMRGQNDTLERLRAMVEDPQPTYGALTLYLMRKASEMTYEDMQGEFRSYARALIDAFYLSNEADGTNTRSNWVAWSGFFADAGFRSLAYEVMLSYSDNSGDDLMDVISFLELAVLTHDDKRASAILDSYISRDGDSFYKSKPKLAILYLVEMMRAGRFDKVDIFIDQTDISDFGNPLELSVDDLIQRKLLMVLAAELKMKLSSEGYRNPELWRTFDPLQ